MFTPLNKASTAQKIPGAPLTIECGINCGLTIG